MDSPLTSDKQADVAEYKIESSNLAEGTHSAPILVKKGSLLTDDQKDHETLICFGPGCKVNPEFKKYHDEAYKFIELEKIEDALVIIDKAIANHPKDAQCYALKGECLTKLEKYDEALHVLDQSLVIDATNSDAHLNKAIILQQREQFNDAMKEVNMAIALDKMSAKAYNVKGNIHFYKDEKTEAVKAWGDAIKINPDCSQAYHNIGLALIDQGKQRDSLIYFNKAIHISPDQPLYYCNRGIAQVNQDQELALADFQKAKELIEDPKNHMQISQSNKAYILERIKVIAQLEESKSKFRDVLQKLNINQATYTKINESLQEVSGQSQEAYKKSLKNGGEDQLKELLKKLDDMQKVMDATGLQKKYDMKLSLDELEQHGGINGNLQKEYYCSFYWTLLEYLTAYQQLSLGVFKPGQNAYQFDKSQAENAKQTLYEYGAKFIGTQVKKLTEKVPMIGSIVEYLDEAVDKVLSIRKENIFQKKIRAINDIIKHKKGETLAYEDLSLALQEAAFTLCVQQKDDIVNRVQSTQQHIGQAVQPTEAWKVLIQAIQEFKDKVLATNKTDMFEGEASQMALEDVLVVLVYFFDQSELIINSETKLSIIIKDLVLQQKAKQHAIKYINNNTQQIPNQPLEKDEHCCIVM